MVGALFTFAVDKSVNIDSKECIKEGMTVVSGVFSANPAWLAFWESSRGVWMRAGNWMPSMS